MRQQIVTGNWKMNNDLAQTESLITELKKAKKTSNAEVMVAPTFTNLYKAFEAFRETDIEVIAQNMHFAENGAYTGEISASMLKSVGVNTVILGHSERRAYFNETDDMLAKKVDAALANSMRVIFCFGEELADRKSGNHEHVVESQIKNGLFHLEASAFKNIVGIPAVIMVTLNVPMFGTANSSITLPVGNMASSASTGAFHQVTSGTKIAPICRNSHPGVLLSISQAACLPCRKPLRCRYPST